MSQQLGPIHQTWPCLLPSGSLSTYLRQEGGGGVCGKHHFFSSHTCDRAAEDK